jgi:hypothetical protein
MSETFQLEESRKMSSSDVWRHVGLIRADVSEECVASVFRVEIIREIGLFPPE